MGQTNTFQRPNVHSICVKAGEREERGERGQEVHFTPPRWKRGVKGGEEDGQAGHEKGR